MKAGGAFVFSAMAVMLLTVLQESVDIKFSSSSNMAPRDQSEINTWSFKLLWTFALPFSSEPMGP